MKIKDHRVSGGGKIQFLEIYSIENQIRNKGNYIIEVDKENINSLEVLLTLYGHIAGSIAKQNAVIYG